MRIFVAMWCSLIVAIAVHMIIYNVFHITGYLPGRSFNVAGNATFALVLALFVWRSRSAKLLSFATLVGTVAFVLSCIGVVLAAVTILPHAYFVGLLMTSPVGAIGAYPPGPDVPLPDGAILWGETTFLPIGAGLLLGFLLRAVAPLPTQQANPSST